MRLRVENGVTSVRLWEPNLIQEPENFANDGDRETPGILQRSLSARCASNGSGADFVKHLWTDRLRRTPH